jgi:phospholipase/carboxylesterase
MRRGACSGNRLPSLCHVRHTLTRRSFLALAPSAIALARQLPSTTDGRLTARLKAPTIQTKPGEYPLGLGGERDGLLVVPPAYRHDVPAPLAIMLHGAGGRARRVYGLFSVASELGIIVLAPESRRPTWDAIRGRYGPDVEFLDRALTRTFERCAVDPRRLAIGGFSDGASYGLSLGIGNGTFFTHVLACSPGFIVPGTTAQGRPRIYISHGRSDEILPIDSTSRRIHPALRRGGYTVSYNEFDGPHTVPPQVARDALTWFRGA